MAGQWTYYSSIVYILSQHEPWIILIAWSKTGAKVFLLTRKLLGVELHQTAKVILVQKQKYVGINYVCAVTIDSRDGCLHCKVWRMSTS